MLKYKVYTTKLVRKTNGTVGARIGMIVKRGMDKEGKSSKPLGLKCKELKSLLGISVNTLKG